MSYNFFADYYDKLTQNVDYRQWAEYYLKIFERYGHKPGITLDLACGTGSLTLALADMGVDIYGIDASAEMLSKAQEKALNRNMSILFLRQKMQSIDLYGTIDTCICALDSINHINKEKDVFNTFKRVSLFMNKGGLFVFDVNTLYKQRDVLADNAFVYDTDDVYCVWQNYTENDGKTVEIVLDFFEKSGNSYYRYGESFKETVYDDDILTQMLTQSGFNVLDRFAELSFNSPNATTERVFYVAQKA